ncbi:MAG TPA: IS200/IS605 family transposase [Thermoanaerobaculia bacterium]|nr:IS200/IS605 family transposase [Thermoanaerobaculia bacterium]
MSHTYTNLLVHCIFSTKNREHHLDEEIRSRLWPFIGGIARENGIKALEVGGFTDHVHMLLSLPATMPVAKAMQLIKAGSSRFVKETYARPRFAWQEGYGAFSVSMSSRDRTIEYIRNQEKHHRKRTFQEEFLEILQKHGIDYDPRYVWG